jgi:hypothetical protein
VGEGHFIRPLRGYRCPRDLPPGLKSLRHLLAIHSGREEVAPRAEVRHDRAVSGEKTLCVAWGFEVSHAPLTLASGLVRILGTIIQVPMLPMFDTGQELSFRRPITLEFIRHNHPRDVRQPFEQLAEKLLGRGCIAAALHQNI